MPIQCGPRWVEGLRVGTVSHFGLHSASLGPYSGHGRHLWPIGICYEHIFTIRFRDFGLFKSLFKIGVSYNLSNVSIYVIDLKKVAPFGDSLQTSSGLGVGVGIGGGGGGTNFQHGQTFRKSFNKERPPGGVRQNQIKMNHDTQESDEKSSTETEDDAISTADIKDLNHYHNIFQPRGRECKSFHEFFSLWAACAFSGFCMSHVNFGRVIFVTLEVTFLNFNVVPVKSLSWFYLEDSFVLSSRSVCQVFIA